MSDRDKQIRNEAYRLWEEAGRPDRDDQAYWYEAEKRIAAGEREPVPPLRKAKDKSAEATTVAKNAGNSGVQAKAVMAPAKSEASKTKTAPSKGDAVEIGLSKKKSAANANAKKPAIEKAKKPKR